jgi:hypothetical protein
MRPTTAYIGRVRWLRLHQQPGITIVIAPATVHTVLAKSCVFGGLPPVLAKLMVSLMATFSPTVSLEGAKLPKKMQHRPIEEEEKNRAIFAPPANVATPPTTNTS